MAALSHDWKVAIWDRPGNRLLNVIEVPIGFHADNAGLTFDAEAKRFAFAPGVGPRCGISRPGRLQTWSLPPALVDDLVFVGDRLLSFRVETSSGKVPPTGGHPKGHPRVGVSGT